MAKSNLEPAVASMDWRQAIVEKARSVRFRSLTPEMLTDEGDIVETKDGDVILFDIEFVYHALTEKFLKPLGLVGADGTVREKFILNTLIPKAIEYARNYNEREAEVRRYEMAVLMSKYNGRSVDDNLELLKRKEESEEE